MDYSFQQLVDQTGVRPKEKATRTKILAVRGKKGFRRFIFLVKGGESYSSPKGHLSTILYPTYPMSVLRSKKTRLNPLSAKPLNVWCTCPAFHYWGSHYWSTLEDYRVLDKPEEDREPVIRDPERQNYLCKHLVRLASSLKMYSFSRLINLFDSELSSKKSSEDIVACAIAETLPTVSDYLHRIGYKDDEVEDVILSLDEDNYEDILLEHGVII